MKMINILTQICVLLLTHDFGVSLEYQVHISNMVPLWGQYDHAPCVWYNPDISSMGSVCQCIPVYDTTQTSVLWGQYANTCLCMIQPRHQFYGVSMPMLAGVWYNPDISSTGPVYQCLPVYDTTQTSVLWGQYANAHLWHQFHGVSMPIHRQASAYRPHRADVWVVSYTGNHWNTGPIELMSWLYQTQQALEYWPCRAVVWVVSCTGKHWNTGPIELMSGLYQTQANIGILTP